MHSPHVLYLHLGVGSNNQPVNKLSNLHFAAHAFNTARSTPDEDSISGPYWCARLQPACPCSLKPFEFRLVHLNFNVPIYKVSACEGANGGRAGAIANFQLSTEKCA